MNTTNYATYQYDAAGCGLVGTFPQLSAGSADVMAIRRPLRRKVRGQAAIIIAISCVALIAVLGLAIDGGSTYERRRSAQNAADGSSMAAARVMLGKYDAMILAYAYDVDGDALDDQEIDQALTTYGAAHGVSRNRLEAYYVNESKQVVGSAQVGNYGSVPWTQGAKGIAVIALAETETFFMGMFGWDIVSAKATATAFMGVAADSGVGLPLMPVGFFTETGNIDNLVIGQEYTLIVGDTRYGSGNWGWVNFNEETSGSRTVVQAWLACGFNPNAAGDSGWGEWAATSSNPDCLDQMGVNHAGGPTSHYTCGDPGCTIPADNVLVPYLKWGRGSEGWWLAGSSGTVRSNCEDLDDFLQNNNEYFVPIFDFWTGGSQPLYHLAAIGKFLITSDQVDCHARDETGRPYEHWHIRGVFQDFYTAGATGRHGDLRHTSGHVVFQD